MNIAVRYQSRNGNTKAVAEIIANQVGQIVAFSTTGAEPIGIKQITECAKNTGIKVNESTLCLKMYLKGHKIFGQKGGKLSELQKKKIEEFVENVKKCEK